jgi:hypothetical protein
MTQWRQGFENRVNDRAAGQKLALATFSSVCQGFMAYSFIHNIKMFEIFIQE